MKNNRSYNSNDSSWDLAQDQSKILSLFANANISYQSLNCKGILVEVNDRWLKTFGYIKEEVLGRWFGDILTLESQVLFIENFEAMCSTDKVEAADLIIVCKDGSRVSTSISRLGSFDEEDKLIRTHCILQNISKIDDGKVIEPEEELDLTTVSEDKIKFDEWERKQISLKKITESSPMVLFQYTIKNLKFKLHYVSDNIVNHTGYTKEWITEKHENFRKLVHSDDRATILAAVLMPGHKKNPKPFTFRIITKNNEVKWIRHYASYSKIDGKNCWTGACLDISEEHKLKKELDETNIKYSEILSSSASVNVEVSLLGYINTVSESLTAFSGYKPEEIIGKHIFKTNIFPKDQIGVMKSVFSDLVRGKIPEKPVEFRWTHKNGKLRYGEALYNIIGEKRSVKKIQVLLFDTTDKKKLEFEENKRHLDLNFLFEASISLQKIHEEKDFYEFVAKKLKELIPDSIINVNSVNDEYTQLKVEEVLGISRIMEKTVGNLFNVALKGYTIKLKPGVFDYAKPGKLDTFNSSLYEMTMGEIPEFICNKVEKLIGFDRCMEASLGTVDQIMGGVSIFLRKDSKVENKALIEAFLREASNTLIRIKVQNQLKKSEYIHRSLAENTDNLILRLDKDANILYLNPVAERKVFIKIQLEDKLPLYQSGLHLEETRLLLEEFNKVLKSRKSRTAEIPITRNGNTMYFNWFFYPEFSGNKMESVLVYANDITERKVLENDLYQSIEFRRKLYAILAHDLRTPFNSMLGFFELLQKNYEDLSDDKRKNYINILKLSTDKAYDLLDSVLLWSRDVENLKESIKESCKLKEIIDDIEILNNAKLKDKKIRISCDFGQKVCVNADRNMLAAIFRNLISNAIKFSHSNSEIHISVEESKENHVFQIKDRGVGMDVSEMVSDDEITSKIIKVGTAGEKGSGLGLSFVKEFVRRSSGKIWFESESGKGTSVFVQLPKCSN